MFRPPPAFLLPRCLGFGVVVCLLASAAAVAQTEPPAVDFDRDIRAIFSDYCFKCHGPDEAQRQAELRLDTQEGAFRQRDGAAVIVPGKPEESELLRRIRSHDEDERMPPAETGRRLDPQQVERIRNWIAQGANWQQHWSFVPPQRPPLPPVSDASWPHNAIDYFVLARLDREGIRPAPPAERTTLIRRVTLDLTGLPPTPEEVANFLADDAPHAYERLVERLLASPRYGERMALVWLDAARYADTSGYQNDGPRSMWRWRDWVIDAYNRGLPFDRFTTEQLAGDLLPAPTLDQLIATGFNRNHRGNSEGGVIPEEFQVEYVVDRVETTGTVWLGLTIGCSRCHEHKFDPISQREFYQFYAYFNNVPENGRAIKEGNSPPYVQAPTPLQQRQLAGIEAALREAEERFAAQQDSLAAAQQAWEAGRQQVERPDWSIARGLVAHVELDGAEQRAAAGAGEGAADQPAADDAAAPPPAYFVDGDPAFAPGRIGTAGDFDGQRFVAAGDVGDFGYFDKFSCAAWVFPRGDAGGTIVSRMTDVAQGDGYYLQLAGGRLHVNLVKRWLDDCIRVRTEAALPAGQWTHVTVTYDGSRVAEGIGVYLNGQPVDVQADFDFINQTFAVTAPLRVGGGGGPGGRFHGRIDDVRVYQRCLPAGEAAILAVPESIDQILAVPAEKRSPQQAHKLAAYFLDQHAPPDIRQAHQRLVALREQRAEFVEQLPTVMVMAEMASRRPTHVLERGQYDKPAEAVAPAVPTVFPPLPAETPNNRLGLARWLVDPGNPLTARVAVNRYWQTIFGTGLVKTAEDFGSQGERPSHPQLLDWLASEFVHSGWDVKGMQRRIVTSATYRQSSRVTAEQLARDPDNRWLSRGPRFRLPAEVVRDQALAASGLLAARLGGPSVKPYQPGDLWQDIATDNVYEQDQGENLYRRSMYTYWKRTVVPPVMATFDGSGREMCSVRPRRTNTPLQALTLLNDVTFVEAARVLAQQVMREAVAPPARLERLFRRVLARPPQEHELAILRGALERFREDFQSAPEAARELVHTGEYPIDQELDVVQLAAYTTVASMILNLDEAVTKQ